MNLISVTEAQSIIASHIQQLSSASVNLYDSVGLKLAETIHSSIDLPPFHQSAMDGYAIAYDSCDLTQPIKIVGEVATGNAITQTFDVKGAVRIFTGAEMPLHFDTVIMQEKVVRQQNQLTINDELLRKGQNVRLQGSHTQRNQIVIDNEAILTPASVGFLASIGVSEVKVIPQPKIGIIVTGNELIKTGEKLTSGKIFESNSYTLSAILKLMQIPHSIIICKDNLDEITTAIINTTQQNDVVLLTGGISVGDYDYALPALINAQYEILFHKIKQKPGKPICFAKHDNKIAFALPGNPASVLTCFYEYVAPALFQLMGQKISSSYQTQLPLTNSYKKKAGLTHFLKGIATKDGVTILNGQESYRMDSFAQSNCLIKLNEAQESFEIGEMVEVHLTDALIKNYLWS